MKIGEHDLALSQLGPLAFNRLFYLHDHLGLGPHGVRTRRDLRTGRSVRVVAEARTESGALLDQHRVPITRQRLRAGRHQRNAMLRGLDLLRHADDHGFGPSEITVCLSGWKNSLASADNSSSVSASTVRS